MVDGETKSVSSLHSCSAIAYVTIKYIKIRNSDDCSQISRSLIPPYYRFWIYGNWRSPNFAVFILQAFQRGERGRDWQQLIERYVATITPTDVAYGKHVQNLYNGTAIERSGGHLNSQLNTSYGIVRRGMQSVLIILPSVTNSLDLFSKVTSRCIVDFIKEIGFYRRIWSTSFLRPSFLSFV